MPALNPLPLLPAPGPPTDNTGGTARVVAPAAPADPFAAVEAAAILEMAGISRLVIVTAVDAPIAKASPPCAPLFPRRNPSTLAGRTHTSTAQTPTEARSENAPAIDTEPTPKNRLLMKLVESATVSYTNISFSPTATAKRM